MKTKLSLPLLFLLFLALSLSACQLNVSRDPSGGLTVETSITEDALQKVINEALDDSKMKSIQVELKSGYAQVSGEREREKDASKTDSFSFRLELGVSAGRLTASISNVKVDGFTLDDAQISRWNEKIAEFLQKAGQKHENVTLEAVSVTPQQVQMTWHVDKK